MQALLNAGLGGHLRDLVVFGGRLLDLVQRRRVAGSQRGRDHLRDADLLGPGDARGLLLAQLAHAEMGAHAGQTAIGKNLLHLLGVGQAGELGVAERRAQLQGLNPNPGQLLYQAGEIAILDHRAVGIGLAPDRQAEGRGRKRDAAGHAGDDGADGGLGHELSS